MHGHTYTNALFHLRTDRSSEILKLEMKKMPKSIEKVHVINYYDGYVMSVTLLYTTVSIEFVIRMILLFWYFEIGFQNTIDTINKLKKIYIL